MAHINVLKITTIMKHDPHFPKYYSTRCAKLYFQNTHMGACSGHTCTHIHQGLYLLEYNTVIIVVSFLDSTRLQTAHSPW